MVNARKGVGYMVEAARKVLDFERVYAGIIAIGLAAFLFRWLLTLPGEPPVPVAPAIARRPPNAAAAVAARVPVESRGAMPNKFKISLRNVSPQPSLSPQGETDSGAAATSTSKWKTPSRRTAAMSASSACCWGPPAAANPPFCA